MLCTCWAWASPSTVRPPPDGCPPPAHGARGAPPSRLPPGHGHVVTLLGQHKAHKHLGKLPPFEENSVKALADRHGHGEALGLLPSAAHRVDPLRELAEMRGSFFWLRPSPIARPSWKFRDRGELQVTIRSPTPAKPSSVKGLAPLATANWLISARPRVRSMARGFSPAPRAVAMPEARA